MENNSKVIRYSGFSKNVLGTAYPKPQVLSTKKGEDGSIYYYIYFGKNSMSGWYTKDQVLKFGIRL